jgi:serine/threonine-protein kinase
MSFARTDLPVDHMLAGRYRIADRLGAGGMAVVFLAEDTVLDRWVAIKRLRAAAPEQSAERFDREAKLGAWLNHPNLVTIYDTLSDTDGVLIVMEYVPGRALSQLIEHRRLEPGRAVAALWGVAAALDHAHSHGVVHRDVKPSNVLIRDDGVVKLADLGVATAAHVSRITTVSDVVGTLAYIAPERLEGEEKAGPPADVYSLAAVAFESLSGRRAQQASGPAEILEIASSRPPPDLRDAWRKAPAAAAEVLRRGLSADPEERPSSASELVRELEEALEPVMESAPSQSVVAPTAAPERPGRTEVTINVPRPGRIAALVASLALAAAGIVIGLNLATDEEPPAERAAAGGSSSPDRDTGKAEANAPTPEASAEEPEPAGAGTGAGNPAAGAQLNDQGYALIQQGRYEEAVPILRRAVESFPEGSRDLNYAYALYNLGQALRLAGQPEEAVPILERRLEIPNQRGTVKRELDAARAQAAQ